MAGLMAQPAQPRRERSKVSGEDSTAIAEAVRLEVAPLAKSVTIIEQSVARMAGSHEEHKTHVHAALARIESATRSQAEAIGRLSGIAEQHDGDLRALFAERAKRDRTVRQKLFSFTSTHLTLVLTLAIAVIVVIGTAVGVDLRGVVGR